MTIRLTVLIACLFATGCSRGDIPRARPISVQGDIFLQVKSCLEGYSSGQPVGSEQQLFGSWTDEMRAKDPGAAELLVAGLQEIAASPRRAKFIATRLLTKLPAESSAEKPTKGLAGTADAIGKTTDSSR